MSAAPEENLYTVEDALGVFLEDLDRLVGEGIRSPGTRRDYERLLRLALDLPFTANGQRMTLRDVPVIEVSPAMIRGVLTAYARTTTRYGRPPAPNSVRNLRNALGSLLGAEFDLIDGVEVPTARVNLKRIHGRERTGVLRQARYLKEADFPELLRTCTPNYRPLVKTILHTGLRSAEARGLRRMDIVLDGPTPGVFVRGQADDKTGCWVPRVKKEASRRFVPLWEPEVVAFLRDHLADVPEHPETLVFATRSGRAVSKPNLWTAVHNASGDGLPELSVHDLRHSCAIRWIMSGIPLNAVSKALGHAHPGITSSIYLSAPLDDETLYDTFANPKGMSVEITDDDEEA